MSHIKKSPNYATAELLVKGTGGTRSRDEVIAEVCTVIDTAFERGVLEGRRLARESVLREALAIARGAAQEANARALVLETELANARPNPTTKG